MRTKTLVCRLKKLQNARLLHGAPRTGSGSNLTARPMSSLLSQSRGISRVAESGARSVLFGDVSTNATRSLQHVGTSLGSVRLMGIGSFKEGNRAGQHGLKYPQAKPDGSPEKAETDARKQFLEKAKEEAASNTDEAQEPFRDAVESEQTIGKATTELEFGVRDGKTTNEAISNASEQLFKQSTINVKSSAGPIKEEDKRKYPEHQRADVSSEASAEKDEEGGTHSEKMELRGQETESVMGIGGQRSPGESLMDESSGPGERARENIEKTRSEMREGKERRSPQAGVIVGNVTSVGANALENEDDVPPLLEETTDETLDKAQKSYEQAISGFGTGGDKNLKDDPMDTSDAKFRNSA